MIAFAEMSRSSEKSRRSAPGAQLVSTPATLHTKHIGLQRKAMCACGGGCPRCAGKTAALLTKLQVSEPGEQYEQEADRVADQVMRMPVPQSHHRDFPTPTGPLIQRKCSSSCSADVTPSIDNVLGSSGVPLDAQSREFFESRFGHDFSNVRVHSDVQAAESAQQLRARAYTVGSNIVFGAGQYQPQTTAGRHLLAHELTHALQQGATRSPLISKRAAPHIARAPLDLTLLNQELNAGGALTQSQGEIGHGSARGAATDAAAEDTSLPIEAVVHRRTPPPRPPAPPPLTQTEIEQACGDQLDQGERLCTGSNVNDVECLRAEQAYMRCLGRHFPQPPLIPPARRALIVGGIHGDEGGLVATRTTPGRVVISERLQTELSGGLQNDFDTILIPVMNPGGLIDGTRWNRHHIDLNRNFPGLSGFPAGTPQIEQPETAAVRRAVEILQPSRILVLHAHSDVSRAGFFADPVEGEARELACRMAMQVLGTTSGTGTPASNVMVRGNKVAQGVCESRYPDASTISVTTTQSSLGAWGSAPTSAGGRGTTVITHEIPDDATPLPEQGAGRSVDTVMPGIRDFLRDHRHDPSEADALLRRSVTTTFLSGQATAADERLRDTIGAIVDRRFNDLDAFYSTVWRPAQPAAVRRRLPKHLTAPSHTRDFQRQARIVLRELRGLTASSADPDIQQEILRVMETISLPGFSRHHWGTELDIVSAERVDWDPTTGRFRDLIPFLQEHAFRFGFFHPYTAGFTRPAGAPAQAGFLTPAARHYLEEPWHISYWPIATVLRQLWIDNFIDPATQQVIPQLITDTAQAIRGRVPQATMERVLNSIGLGTFQTNVAPSP